MNLQFSSVLAKIFVITFALGCISSRPISKAELYIEQYKYIAISEMKRSGIPASIKLAQGLLESAYGNSPLAVNANNHFGIKCKNTWGGPTYLHKDDDLDASGNLIASCFRVYNSPEDSYIDHTEFLTNRDRYKPLFSFDKTDYVNWAYGLKNCGYATNPKYPDLLIETIKKFNLDNLDKTEDAMNFTINKPELSIPLSPVPVKTYTAKAKKSGRKHSNNTVKSRKRN